MDPKRNEILWWAIMIALLFFCWPVGLVLLFLKIFKNKPDFQKKSRADASSVEFRSNQADRSDNTQSRADAGSTDAAQPEKNQTNPNRWSRPSVGVCASDLNSTGNREKRRLEKKRSGGRGLFLKIIGGTMTGLFGFCAVSSLTEMLASGLYSTMDIIREVNPMMIFCAIGAVLLTLGVQRDRKSRRLRRYITLLGEQPALDLHLVSKTTGIRYERVLDDIQDFTDSGAFGKAFVDVARGILVVRAEDYSPQPAKEDTSPADANPDASAQNGRHDASSDNEILLRIRAANDAIENEEISAKIDEIGILTAKIFRLVDENPEKESEIRSFTAYYLPQTLKILNAYARLEKQGVEGQNISDAKQRIETMLNKLTEGYAAQLDRLFGSEVLDITSDITVMEQMLARDGLVADDLQLIHTTETYKQHRMNMDS